MSDKGYEEDAGDADALTKEEEAKCWEAFSAFDKDSSGYIDANELRIVLEMMGQKTTEEEIFRMIAEADAENTGKITYTQFTRVIAEQKKNQSLSNEEDTLDAFVSMGGQPDGEGVPELHLAEVGDVGAHAGRLGEAAPQLVARRRRRRHGDHVDALHARHRPAQRVGPGARERQRHLGERAADAAPVELDGRRAHDGAARERLVRLPPEPVEDRAARLGARRLDVAVAVAVEEVGHRFRSFASLAFGPAA